MADFQLKANDRLPAIEATLSQRQTDGTEGPIDLTDATSVTFIMKSKDTGTVKINAPATIVNAVTGLVRYDWLTADTNVVGSYQAEWQILWPLGRKQTVPTASYHTIDILADLDDA